jgi:hypothetical protein
VASVNNPKAIIIERKNMVILSMDVMGDLKEGLFYSRVY